MSTRIALIGKITGLIVVSVDEHAYLTQTGGEIREKSYNK
jgi:hypothetical protein